MESAEKKLRAVVGFEGNGPVARSGRGLVAQVGHSPIAVEATDRVSAQSNHVNRLIHVAQTRVSELVENHAPITSIARDIRAFLSDLVRLHTGVHQVDLGLDSFLDQLWEQAGFADLVRQLVAATDPSSAAFETITSAELGRDFAEVAKWYQRRIASLSALDSRSELGQLADQIFRFQVVHDRNVGGVSGMEVSCGVRCIGRAGQPLWLKILVAHDEGYVGPAPGWECWADSFEGHNAEIRFAAIMSLSHPWQKFIADRVNIFIPYEALDLNAGRVDLQLEAVLFDERGAPLASAYRDELVSIVKSVDRQVTNNPMCTQPQVLGVWANEFVYGNAVTRFEVCRRFDSGVRNGGRTIEAWYDLDLIGQRGKPVTVEFCLQRADGSLVSNLTDGSPISIRHAIHSINPVTRLRSQGLSLSLRNADVLDQEELYAELSVLEADGRLLCGLVVPVTDALAIETARPGATSIVDRRTACTLRSMQVNPDELFSQHRFVQVLNTINLPAFGIEPWQVVVKILDGENVLVGRDNAELSRSVWIQDQTGESGRLESDTRVVTINFDQEEVLTTARLNSERKIKLQCQTQIFSSKGILVSEGICPFALAVPENQATAGVLAAHPGAPLWIESVNFATNHEGNFRGYLSLNVLQSSPESESIKIYYELVDAHGQPLTKTIDGDGSSANIALPGNILSFNLAQKFAGSAMPRRWFQTNVEFQIDSEGVLQARSDVFLKLMLFSAHGHLEQVIRQPLPRSGLLTVAFARSDEGAVDRLEDIARDTANSKKRRGFFAWH